MGKRRRGGSRSIHGIGQNIVSFLDANISFTVGLHLLNLQRYARWVTFDSFGSFDERKKQTGSYTVSAEERRAIWDFFSLTGDRNVLDPDSGAPHKLKDWKLFTYMTRLIRERFPLGEFFLFYTHDRGFFTQEKMSRCDELVRYDPAAQIAYFDGGEIQCSFLPQPESDYVRKTAYSIRHDFERRIERLFPDMLC